MTLLENVARIRAAVQNIATAITNKGVTIPEGSTVDDYADLIDTIEIGTDVSDTTAVASDVMSGKSFYTSDGTKTNGTIDNIGAWSYSIKSGDSVNIPRGYHNGNGILSGKAAEGKYITNVRGANIDMGVYNSKRYLDTTCVPNSNTDTFECTLRGSGIDMGSTNSYRYVDSSVIPNFNSETYTPTTKDSSIDLAVDNAVRYINTVNLWNIAASSEYGNSGPHTDNRWHSGVNYLTDYGVPVYAENVIIFTGDAHPTGRHWIGYVSKTQGYWWLGCTTNTTGAVNTIGSGIASSSQVCSWDPTYGWTYYESNSTGRYFSQFLWCGVQDGTNLGG